MAATMLRNKVMYRLQYAPSAAKMLHKTMQQTHKSFIESSRNISEHSLIKSGMDVEVDVPDEDHYGAIETSEELHEEEDEENEENKESMSKMAFESTLSKEDVIYSEYKSENNEQKDSSDYIKPETEMNEISSSETGFVTTSETSKSFPSVVTLPSHFLVQNVNSDFNVLYYVSPNISDSGVEEINTPMNINNPDESVLKIQKSDSLGFQSQQFVIVPMNTSTQHGPTNSRINPNKKRTLFKCGVCNKLFMRKVHLSSHQITIHDDLKCHRCGIKVENADNLLVHIKSHLKSKNSAKALHTHKKTRKVTCEPAICDVCGKMLQNPMSLTRHMMLHTGIRPFACDLCNKTFCTKLSRDDHRHTHTGEKPYVCDMCGRMFSYRSHLSLHRNSHSDERPYECAFCKKRFNRRQYLILHIRTHTGEKPYACDICSRAFAQRNDMNKHRLTHSSERSYVCKCGLSFKQKRDLHKHEREHDMKEENHDASGSHVVYIEEVEDPNSLELT